MRSREHLLLAAGAYEGAAGTLSLARVGTIVRNDGKFFARLRDGRDCTTSAYDVTLQWFSDHWPPDVPWPDPVPRPGQAARAQDDSAPPSPAPGSVPVEVAL